ncbi:ABC transporter permease [Nocardia arthritidis]|uniref:Transport permease protein n=1 Tax=Nocardia arthritidis TaxID=228602 RepID=A0A6G9YTL5_9NOCA|nr:ABC transporter permease [Nocardia arthritidis]QIS16675.1 ABC transporter permease subunit [Nocardia arthritidis]
MNPMVTAVRAGIQRGVLELGQMATNPEDLFGALFFPIGTIVALYFMRNGHFADSGFGLGALALPSILGMLIAFNGTLVMAQLLVVEKEDGTLLRAKATPNGMTGYLIGKIVTVSCWVLFQFTVVLVAGLILIGGTRMGTATAWIELIGIVLLGLLATLPIGAILGSVLSSPRSFAVVSLVVMVVVSISGIFYPISSLSGWLQGLGQVFPIYWMGLGVRSAMLPDAMSAVEIGQSWRHFETFGALGAWVVVGLILAPITLRRMARRESGSGVDGRRDKALQRAY